MAQKSQHVIQSEEQPKSTSSSSSSKKDASSTPSMRQATTTASTSGSSVLPRMSDPVPKSESASPSPPAMDKPTSSGAGSAAKDTGSATASPYGTRSRNRTGASRPNYAEDKDIDMELFDYGDKRDDKSKKPTRKSNTAANSQGGADLPGNPPPKPAPADDSKNGTAQNGTKEQPSAALSSASNATTTGGPAQSKKRKAASQSVSTNSQAQAASNSQSASQPKKAAATSYNGSGASHGNGIKIVNGSDASNNRGYSETNMLTFENCKAMPTADGKMVADDGTVLGLNDHIYLICEPPGEPYYLARIMEWVHSKNDPKLPVDQIRVNWFYRPKDVGRKAQDTRTVLATMHSDSSPLTSLRGKCQVRHKAEIADMAAYKRSPDCFWYEKLYDRFLMKNYDVIPSAQIVNVPRRVKKVLDDRWKFILVEQGRGKELTSAVKSCKRCSGYCASNDSVDCAVCQNTYHMNCVRPPLLKKPSRGFAWSCAACSRAQERRLEARNTLDNAAHDGEDDEFVDEEEDDHGAANNTTRTSPDEDLEPIPLPTEEQIRKANLFPYRYLGIYCKVEDVLDYDDRTSPRSGTRVGPRHQANVLPWPGRPVEYVKPLEMKKSNRKDGKPSKEMQAAIEAERAKKETRPKWVQDEPAGYVERGGDDTVTLLWQPPDDCGVSMSGEAIDEYMNAAKSKAVALGLPKRSTNLQDVAMNSLYKKYFDPQEALKELDRVPKAEFREPELTQAEQKKFEEGVAKFGSELHSVYKHVKTVFHGDITRYYYTWKKTERGQQIWGNYSGRKGKSRKVETPATQLADDVADDCDDSAFDAEKAVVKKKGFICKFCSTKTSRQWRRAPNAATTLVTENGGRANKDKGNGYIQALCRRCAELWRRYAIQWEDIDEVAKKVAVTGGRGWRRRVDEELYKELVAADEMVSNIQYRTPDASAAASPSASSNAPQAGQEPPRKKLKGLPDKDPDVVISDASTGNATHGKKKDKSAEKAAPEIPKPKTLPCAICYQMEPLGDQHLSCKECRLAVHRSCYGILDNRAPGKWTCDMCANDKNPQVSINYKCVLCPVDHTEHDFVEPPKLTAHKKKLTEKDRERDRAEREAAQKAADYYRKKQEEMNRPVNPREPLKRTADNNWVHVTCAVWTPEIKFAKAKALATSEGIPLVPRSRYAETCKVCKKQEGACVSCHHCKASVHVECAHHAGYLLGFEINPVKGSRRDQHNIVNINGESGTMVAAIWCKEHPPTKSVVHRMFDPVDDTGMNALQLYSQQYKQADLTLTGCARKANQIMVGSKMSAAPVSASLSHRRASTTTLVNGDREQSPTATHPGGKICLTCGVDVSPKWYPIDQAQERELTNGYYGNLGAEAQKFVEQRSFQCHKCKKANRQPKPHQPAKEPTPPPEPVRQPTAPLASPPLAAPADVGRSSRGPYPWSPRIQAAPGPVQAIPPPPPPPPPSQSVPLQAPAPGPTTAPIPPPPAQSSVASAVVPPSLPPTRGPPLPSHYPPQHPPQHASQHRYNDWHRPPVSHHHSPVLHHRELSGGPPPPLGSAIAPPLAPPNHLRPPPLSGLSHPPPPPPPNQNSHVSQPPYVNGIPPSPRRVSGVPPPPPPQNSAPYMSPRNTHGPPDPRDHHRIPPLAPSHVAPEAQSSLNVLRQWNPTHPPPPPPQHQSPPASREGFSFPRYPLPPAPPPPPRELPPQLPRPTSGASANPSLRNLLS